MVGWQHRLDGPEFEQALGVGDRQGNNRKSDRVLFWEALKSLQILITAMKLKDACSFGKGAMTNLDCI